MSAVLSWRYCYERTQRGALGLCAYVHTKSSIFHRYVTCSQQLPHARYSQEQGGRSALGTVSCKLPVRLLRRRLMSDNTAGMLCQLARRLSSGSSVPRQPFVRLWRPPCGCQHSDCNRCSPVLRQLSAALQGGKPELACCMDARSSSRSSGLNTCSSNRRRCRSHNDAHAIT